MSRELNESYSDIMGVVLGAFEGEDLPRIEWEEGVPGIIELYVKLEEGKKIALIIERSFLNELNTSMELCEKTERKVHK